MVKIGINQKVRNLLYSAITVSRTLKGFSVRAQSLCRWRAGTHFVRDVGLFLLVTLAVLVEQMGGWFSKSQPSQRWNVYVSQLSIYV